MLNTVVSLEVGPTGTLVRPEDSAWDDARAAWVCNLDQRPSAVAVVRSLADVSAVVRSAARSGLRVVPQGTGHGAAPLGDLQGCVLVRTTALDRVDVDPKTRTAWVGAGALWGPVVAAVEVHGLVVQAGSSPDVGVAGFLLSGGISWLSRGCGLAVNDVLAIQIVGADGAARVVDQEHDPDVFWALRGGGGAFGVVTAFQLRLHPIASLSAGTLFFPIQRAGEVLHTWRHWLRDTSTTTMSCARLLQLPPLPDLPPALSGQALMCVELVHQGDLAELAATITPLRTLGPSVDTIAEIPVAALSALHMDPPGPTPCRGSGMLIADVAPSTVDSLVAAAGHGSASPLLSVELRQLGGALAERPPGAGAVGHLDATVAMYAVGVTPDTTAKAKVETHLRLVERSLSPWAAELHYANFDESRTSGRERFHDAATVARLVAIKHAVDPDDLFGGSHPVAAGVAKPC